MEMTVEILNIINAVIDYKKYICSHNRIFHKDNFDWFSETEKYFNSLPLPNGMKHNRRTFEKILVYLENMVVFKTLNETEEEDLNQYYF